jgi:ribonuclease P protein component
MLPRRSRLTKERDFQSVYKVGRRRAGRYFLVRIAQSRLPETRAAVVVSTKVSKRAVIRNRLKRHARVVLQEVLPKLAAGLNIIVTVRQMVKERADWPDYREDLRIVIASPI